MAKQTIGNILKVEVIHLDSKDNESDDHIITEEMIKTKIREIRKNLLKSGDELITDLDLSTIDNNASEQRRYSSLKNYYEEKLYRLAGSVKIVSMSNLTKTKRKDRVKEILQKICQNEHLSNTWFGLVDQRPNVLRYLSPSDEPLTRLKVPKLNGFSLGTIIDMTSYVEHYSSLDSGTKDMDLTIAKDDIMSDFQFDKKQMILYFRLRNYQRGKLLKNIRYRFEVEFKAISSAIVSVDKNTMKIYFSLSHPPILFKVGVDDMSPQEVMKEQLEREARRRYRKRKFKVYKNVENDIGTHTYEIKNSEHWIRDNDFYRCSSETIGKSTVLRLEIPCIKDQSKERRSDVIDPYQLLFLMRRFTRIPIHFAQMTHHQGPDNNVINQQIYRVSNSQSLVSQLRSKFKNKDKNDDPFPIEYATESVFSFNYKCSDELFIKRQFDLFIKSIIEFSRLDADATEEALFQLRKLCDRSAIFCTLNALTYLFKELYVRNEKCKNEKIDIKSFNTEIEYIRRCILTPTRLILLEAEPTLRSRFIRENDADFTIRLSIREDDLQSLQFSIRNLNNNEMTFLHKIIKNPLKRGIEIGDRLFEFLGSSTSQLRDTGMIMYAKDMQGRTAESIRESIGDMSEIRKDVAKYVARLGLAFSQVMTHIDVPMDQTEVVDDIEIFKEESDPDFSDSDSDIDLEPELKPKLKPKSKRKVEYNFSDGIGRVSAGIMQKVYRKLKLEPGEKPSAIQIRYGGAKGMLAFDPTLKGDKIIFRKV